MKNLTAVLAFACFTLQCAAQGAPTIGPETGASTGASTAAATPPAPAESTVLGAPTGSHWRFVVSPYTLHYGPSPEHRSVYMIGLEKQRDDGFVVGGSFFRNSFGQPSAYAYGGMRYNNLTPYEPLFVQVTGGLLYGYKPPFDKKVPLNYKGFSPGAVLSVGWMYSPMYSAQLNFLGNSALMFQLSADFR